METRTIGVIGGGQLCRLMGYELLRSALPYNIIALDPTENCPASPYIREQLVGNFKDEEQIRRLADRSDVLTFEIELADSQVLKSLEDEGKIIAPSPRALYLIQDKYRQKEHLRKRGVSVPDFREINSGEEFDAALEDFGYPALVKARCGSYDGRGNYKIESSAQRDEAYTAFGERAIMLERYVSFDCEVSVIAARDRDGNIATFPVSENIHYDNILHMTIMPARISERAAQRAKDVAYAVMETFEGAGVFGIEMFVVNEDDILVNEIAPRVHNSGHHTLEATVISQFAQHIRAITGMPLGDTKSIEGIERAVMCNILGPASVTGLYGVEGEIQRPGVFLHLYGKQETKPQRKLGHITMLNVSLEEAERIRNKVRVVKR